MLWPGNIRELENVIEESDIPTPEAPDTDHLFAAVTSNFPTLSELEERYIRVALEKAGGRKSKASQILGINRRTLCRKEREYGWASTEH